MPFSKLHRHTRLGAYFLISRLNNIISLLIITFDDLFFLKKESQQDDINSFKENFVLLELFYFKHTEISTVLCYCQ